MPYSTVVAGTTITAAWANTNVRDQTVIPFASSAARASAITSPVEGMLTYLTDVDKFYGYNGTAWVPATSNIVARQTLTSISAAWSADVTTDFALTGVAVSSARLYKVCLKSEWSLNGGEVMDVNFHVDGVLSDAFGVINTAAATTGTMSNSILWEPATGTVALSVRLDFVSGGSTFVFNASATTPRRFWVEDIGPR